MFPYKNKINFLYQKVSYTKILGFHQISSPHQKIAPPPLLTKSHHHHCHRAFLNRTTTISKTLSRTTTTILKP
jgi:hypothetical protein